LPLPPASKMDGDKDISEKQPLPDESEIAKSESHAADQIEQVTSPTESGLHQTIQFAPAARPGRRQDDEKEDLSKYYVGPIQRRPSIPRVPSEKERARSKREKEAEKMSLIATTRRLT
jgi:hypothetical protein